MSISACHTKITLRPAQSLCCLVLGLTLSVVGCGSTNTRKSSSANIAKNVEASAPELSSRNQSLLAIYSAQIEAAADKIILESPSPAARRLALEWKAEGIPVIQATLLKTDPIAAVLDTWAFLYQMNAFMGRSPQKETLGQSHAVAAEAIQNMDAEMERIVRAAAPNANVAMLRQRVSAWAAVHPIRFSLAGRESVDAEVVKKAEESDMGMRASIKALGESIGDLTARLDSYNTYAPKQARWQAELMLSDLKRDPELNSALSNLNLAASGAAQAAKTVEQIPELVAQTRKAVAADVESQRLAAQSFVRDERLDTIVALRQERLATLAELRGERLAATEDLRGERQVVLQAVRDEEQAVMGDLNHLSDKAIGDLDARARHLIDHFFVRALELVLFTLILCALFVWVLLRWFGGSLLRTSDGRRVHFSDSKAAD